MAIFKEGAKMSQNDEILNYLEKGNTLTALEALKYFGCFRLASRVSDLNKPTYRIVSKMIKTSTGKRVAQYSMLISSAKTLF